MKQRKSTSTVTYKMGVHVCAHKSGLNFARTGTGQTFKPESPARGLRLSPPACTASLVVGSSKAPWPWPWPWIGSRSHQHTQYIWDYQCTQACDCSITQYWNMWSFECREISTFSEVWTLVIPFLEGNSKIGLREAVDQVPYCQYQPSVLSSTRKWQRRYTWKCTFMTNCLKFKWSVTFTLTLDRVKWSE